MVTVTEILARAPLADLEALAGEPAVRLLRALKSATMGQMLLAEFLVHRAGEASALREPDIRDVVLSRLLREEAVEICRYMKLPLADPIASVKTSVSNPAKFERLLGYFKLPAASAFSDDEKPPSQRASPQQFLNTHQTAGYRQLRRALNLAGAKVMVNMPFGAGKMRMIAVAAAELFRSEPDGKLIVWFAPTDRLCEDVFQELIATWEKYGSRPVTVTRAFGKNAIPDLASMTDGLFVINGEAFASEIQADDAGLAAFVQRISTVVIHDVTQLEGTAFGDLYAAMNQSGQVRAIAVCSTTEFGLAGIGKSAILGLFPVKVTLSDGQPIATLKSAATVCEIDVEYLDCTAPGVSRAVVGYDVDFAESELIADDMDRNSKLVSRIAQEIESGSNIVFFAATAQQARMFAGVLSFYGDAPITVTNEMTTDAQLQEVRRYQMQDDRQVLCVHDVLIAGHEAPKVDTVLLAAPTISPTKLSETFGRLATGRAGTRTPLKVIVVDDGIPGFRDLVDATALWSQEDR